MARARATPTDSERFTLADLRHALDRKERELRELLDKKDALARELEELGETLQAMLAGSGTAAPRAARPPRAMQLTTEEGPRAKVKGTRRRAPRTEREGSLQTAIRAVLERVIGPLKVAEIVEAVRKAGYLSKSANLNVIVSNRLAQMDDVEKVDRGLYQLARHDVAPAAASEAAPSDSGKGDAPALAKAATA